MTVEVSEKAIWWCIDAECSWRSLIQIQMEFEVEKLDETCEFLSDSTFIRDKVVPWTKPFSTGSKPNLFMTDSSIEMKNTQK